MWCENEDPPGVRACIIAIANRFLYRSLWYSVAVEASPGTGSQSKPGMFAYMRLTVSYNRDGFIGVGISDR